MRLLLAFRAFIAALFGKKLPVEVVPKALLPEATEPAEPSEPLLAPSERSSAEAGVDEQPRKPRDEYALQIAQLEAEIERLKTHAEEKAKQSPAPELVAVATLGLLQRQGRLLDFLSEDITQYGDADIGAAVREVHRDLKKTLEEHFKIVPLRTEDEDARVTIPTGFDPIEVRLVGNVVGKPPFSGTLKHRGWKAEKISLPQIPSTNGKLVVAPAEVEV